MDSQTTATSKRKHAPIDAPTVGGADYGACLNCNRNKCGKTATIKVARSFYCVTHADQHLKKLQMKREHNRAQKIATEALTAS